MFRGLTYNTDLKLTYTYNALQMGEVLAKDLKLGQYMHLAPRKFEIYGAKVA